MQAQTKRRLELTRNMTPDQREAAWQQMDIDDDAELNK
jgi:hypothetical protein